MTAVEPRFDHDFDYGRQGELFVGGVIAALRGGHVQIEDKRKRRLDDSFYVEVAHDPGRTGNFRPSGLSVTKSEVWAFVIGDTNVALFVPTARLRAVIERGWCRACETTEGSCPTKGWLVNFHQLIARGLDS